MSSPIHNPIGAEFECRSTLMTTSIQVIASDNQELAKEGVQFMEDCVGRLSYFDPNSELSSLNRGPKGEWVSVSDQLYRVLKQSKRYEKYSNGIFRVDFEGLSQKPDGDHGLIVHSFLKKVKLNTDTVINLGGIGKGFIVDETVDFLSRKGAKNILVNAGGDLRVKSESFSWKIGLTNPYHNKDVFGTIWLKDGAIASSGTYARSKQINGKESSHFYNPIIYTYLDSPEYTSVTIQGRNVVESEVYAKLLIMDPSTTLPKGLKGVGVTKEKKAVLLSQNT